MGGVVWGGARGKRGDVSVELSAGAGGAAGTERGALRVRGVRVRGDGIR